MELRLCGARQPMHQKLPGCWMEQERGYTKSALIHPGMLHPTTITGCPRARQAGCTAHNYAVGCNCTSSARLSITTPTFSTHWNIC